MARAVVVVIRFSGIGRGGGVVLERMLVIMVMIVNHIRQAWQVAFFKTG